MNQILRTKTCLPLLLLSITIALLAVVPVHASVLITDCGADLSTPGEYYIIANNITSAGTCLTTGADNIVIDGQGNSIVFAYAFDAEAGGWFWDCTDYFGVSIGHNNVTLKNANITGCGSGSGTTAGGVGIFGLDDVVTNNSMDVHLQGYDANGVVVIDAWPQGPNVTVISNNNITLRGEYAQGNGISTTGSAPVNITGNNIYIDADNSAGLFFPSAVSRGGNFISDNLVYGSRSNFIGIQIFDSLFSEYNSNIFVNNTIISESSNGDNMGVYINSEAGLNIFENNVIRMQNSWAAFYIEDAPYNKISGGSITSAEGLDYYLDAYTPLGYMAYGPSLFLDTNFTDARKIRFVNGPEFKYGDSLSGKPIVGTRISIGEPVLTRTLSLWTQNGILWNDTSSLQGMIAVYNVTGGAPNADYEVTNSSAAGTFTRYLSSDADGNLPVFDVLLEGNNELNVSCVASCIEPPVVDNTPPEAVIGFDTVSKDIVLFNSETGSEVVNGLNGMMAENSRTMMATPTDYNTKGWELRQYTFTDDAGNSLVLALEHKKEGHEVAIRLVSMQYNGGPVIEAPKKNGMKVEYSDRDDGSIKELEQKIEVKDAFTVNAKYSARKNETVIKTKLEGRKERKETKAGLVMLELLTEKGGLAFR